MSQAEVARGAESTTVGSRFERCVADHGGRIALIDGGSGETFTYGQLARLAEGITCWLTDHGVSRGQRVAVWAPNSPAVAAFTLAGLGLGVAVTGINPVATGEEVRKQLANADVRAILTTSELRARAAAFGVPTLTALDALGDRSSLPPTRHGDAAALTDVALLPYSSGTTGEPKGVMLSHANVTFALNQLQQRVQVTENDVTLAVAPFFHILGVTVELLLPLVCGATVVTMSPFAPLPFLELLQRHRVTYLAVPPPVAALLATHPAVDEHDLASLELLLSGGAPMAAETQQQLAARLPAAEIGQGYGLTETTGAVSVPERAVGAPPGTVGRPLPDTEVRVVDTHGEPVTPGVEGEIEARGPHTMVGYLGRPAETASKIRPDGWLRTGDLGHFDSDGNLVIVDRLKDLIKVNGYQVSPTEVEAVLCAHPSVVDAAVVGRPDVRRGEVPIAFVVLANRAAVDALGPWLESRLSPYKQPLEVLAVDALPRNPAGKLLRRELRH